MKIETRKPQEILQESASLLLDITRLAAAILVAVAHFTHPEFGLGYANRQILGDVAVPIFFVLSGFVIRYVTLTRESTAREYFIDRASRIYSVALPAMVFTLVVSGVCFLIDRPQFLRDWSGTFNHPLVRIFSNLIFVSQAWGRNTIPFIDSPFWSLGYECVYYVFYGFLFFLRGWRRIVLCCVVAVIIGPQVLFLLPVWWMGCWVYDVYMRIRNTRVATGILVAVSSWLVIGIVLAVFRRWPVLLAPITVFHAVSNVRNPISLLGLSPARATMFAVAAGIFSAIAMLILLLATDCLHISRANRSARAFRHLANGTFTIYLIHYPFLVFLVFLGLLRPGHTTVNVTVFTGMCILLIVAAVPVDRLKTLIRNWLRGAIPKPVDLRARTP